MKVNLKGELISDDWAEVYRFFGIQTGYYCPTDILAAMEELEDGEELVLQINSVGGDVDAASEIYSAIAACRNPTRAEIQSLAASAASYFPLACDFVAISPPAQMMIHCASWDIGGNKHEHQWVAQQLDATDTSILDTYCRKCGEQHREELQKLMNEETYLTARQCLALGLVDGIIGDDESQSNEEPLRMVASVFNNTVRAMRTLPDIRDMMEMKEALLSKLDKELEAEKARYG